MAPAQALFDVKGFVPFCGGKNEAERGVGSLEGAFEVAFSALAFIFLRHTRVLTA